MLNILIASAIMPLTTASSQNKSSPKGVAIFGIIGGNATDAALTNEAVDYLKKVFTDCGRFMPAGKELETAYNEAVKKSDVNSGNIYKRTAESLNLDIYTLVSVYQRGNIIYSELSVVPLNKEYISLQKQARLRSRIKLNIPLKLGREIAFLHKGLHVKASVIKSYDDNIYLIDAGEWHGIKNNKSYKLHDGELKVIQAGRLESIVRISSARAQGERVLIEIHPDIKKIIKDIDDDISRNTISSYKLEIQGSAEKRLLEGICVINMCGNLCVPGYGAFLSTSHLGFKDTKPDWPGVGVSASAIALHFLLPELMTGFDTNFLPWKQDSDKTEKNQNLQKFLWLTLPVTFSVAYMDQLAHQFTVTEHVPPFFYDKDNVAAIFSLLLPGGGLYYKGHRLAGWGFYFSEMIAAGYAVYNSDSDAGKYALIGLVAVKLLDITFAYFVEPSYSFYNLEKERDIEPVSINMGIKKDPDNRNIFAAMISLNF